MSSLEAGKPTAATPYERLWTANDVAAFLQASRSWVYQKAEAGLIPYFRIGGLLRFDPDAVRRWARGELSVADAQAKAQGASV